MGNLKPGAVRLHFTVVWWIYCTGWTVMMWCICNVNYCLYYTVMHWMFCTFVLYCMFCTICTVIWLIQPTGSAWNALEKVWQQTYYCTFLSLHRGSLDLVRVKLCQRYVTVFLYLGPETAIYSSWVSHPQLQKWPPAGAPGLPATRPWQPPLLSLDVMAPP